LGELRLNLLYRKVVAPGAAVKARAGGGYAAILGLTFNYEVARSTLRIDVSPMAAVGASFEWDVNGPLYAELGLDYIVVFYKRDTFFGFMRPFVGLGWCF
jgi:hypothetical protein